MELITLTLIHTALSFLALGFGIVAIRALFAQTPPVWADVFIILDILVVITGFVFPFKGFTPAIGTGIVASVVLVFMLLARFAFHNQGIWRKAYAIGIVINVFFMMLVTIAQSFQKLPELHVLAPNGSEPPFAVAQLINLAVFAWIGFKAWRVSSTR